MGNRAERPLSLDCGGVHVAAIGQKSASKTAKKDAEQYPSVHKAACGGLFRIEAGLSGPTRLVIDKALFDQVQTRLCKRKQCYFSKVNCGALF